MTHKTYLFLSFLLVALMGCTEPEKKDPEIDRLWRGGLDSTIPIPNGERTVCLRSISMAPFIDRHSRERT